MKTRLARIALAVSHFAFAATVVLMPFRLNIILWAREIPSLYKEYTFYFIFASDAALVLTLVAWLVSLALQPRRLHSGTNWIFAPLFGLTLAGLLSAFFSVDPFVSFYQSVRLGLALGLYLFVVDQVGSLDLLLVPVAFPYFGGVAHEHFRSNEQSDVLVRSVPAKKVGEHLVARKGGPAPDRGPPHPSR